jgi:hypothetical protein
MHLWATEVMPRDGAIIFIDLLAEGALNLLDLGPSSRLRRTRSNCLRSRSVLDTPRSLASASGELPLLMARRQVSDRSGFHAIR